MSALTPGVALIAMAVDARRVMDKVVRITALTLLAAVALVIALIFYNSQKSTSSAATTVDVSYDVSGKAGAVDITYTLPTGDVSQHSGVAQTKAWTTVAMGRFPHGAFVSITVQNAGESGDVGCEIRGDAQTIAANSSSGAYVVATCSGTVP